MIFFSYSNYRLGKFGELFPNLKIVRAEDFLANHAMRNDDAEQRCAAQELLGQRSGGQCQRFQATAADAQLQIRSHLAP